MGIFRETAGRQHDQPGVSPLLHTEPVTKNSKRLPKLRRGYSISGAVLFVGSCAAFVLANNASGAQPFPAAGEPAGQSTTHNVQLQVTGSTSATGTTSGTQFSTPSSSAGSTSVVNSSSSTQSGTKTTVTINGQNIPVPANGTVQRTVTSPDGSSSVNVSSTSSDNSASSVDVNVVNINSSFESNLTQNYVQGQAY